LAYDPEFNVLYRNRGDGTFEDISEAAGIRIPGHRGMSVTPIDYDLDGHPDLYVSNDATPNLLLRNDGQGRFEDVGMQTGVAFNGFGKAEGSMGACVGDVNGDGVVNLLDLNLVLSQFGNACP
ncbi:MAG: FG-GAP repeat domain-containing protein, partial [Phycisphaerales bacterium]